MCVYWSIFFSVDPLGLSVQCSVVTDETNKTVPKPKTTPTKQHNPGEVGKRYCVELLLTIKSPPSAVVRGLMQSAWFENITSSY